MKHILVATDFSTRSDRAVRRATLLAREHGASLVLVHVVDDDQPPRLIRAERRAAAALLSQLARSLREIDGVECREAVTLGDPFAGIVAAAREAACDVAVIGPHRRQALKDVFVGTTAERTVRDSAVPVLMANAVPAGAYRHLLVAVDLSPCSAEALRAVAALGLDRHAALTVFHAFEAPGASVKVRAAMTEREVESCRAEQQERAEAELAAFLGNAGIDAAGLGAGGRIVRAMEVSAAESIAAAAREAAADLIVLGTRGRSGMGKFLLGSVAAEVLRSAERDVLAVPPRCPA